MPSCPHTLYTCVLLSMWLSSAAAMSTADEFLCTTIVVLLLPVEGDVEYVDAIFLLGLLSGFLCWRRVLFRAGWFILCVSGHQTFQLIQQVEIIVKLNISKLPV